MTSESCTTLTLSAARFSITTFSGNAGGVVGGGVGAAQEELEQVDADDLPYVCSCNAPCGKTRGANICDLKEDSACTVTDNFIVVSGDRAGDPFRQWWGDPSWKSAQVTLRVSEGPGNNLKYTKTSNEHEDYVVPDAAIFMDLDYTASPAQKATI